jgi:hypothetical protein
LTVACHFEISVFVTSYAASRSSLACKGLANGASSFCAVALDLLTCCAASDFRKDCKLGSVREAKMSVIANSFGTIVRNCGQDLAFDSWFEWRLCVFRLLGLFLGWSQAVDKST